MKKMANQKKNIDISIVIPLFDEAESLGELQRWIDRVMTKYRYSYEVIYIDDGSKDESWSIIEHMARDRRQIRGIRFRRNYGKSAALYCGFAAAEGEVVITMDADLQDSPEEIPALYRMITEEGYDMVSGWKRKRHDPPTKTIPSKVYNATARAVSGIHLHDMNCGLKAYRKKVIKSIEVYGEMHRYIPILAKWAGFTRIGEKEVQHRARKYGKSKFGWGRMIKGYLDLITVMFTSKFGKNPMYFFGSLGTLMFLLGGGTTIYLIAEKLYKQAHLIAVRGVTEQPLFYIAIMSVLLGVMLFLAGFLGELINRNSSDRNRYLIDDLIERNSNDRSENRKTDPYNGLGTAMSSDNNRHNLRDQQRTSISSTSSDPQSSVQSPSRSKQTTIGSTTGPSEQTATQVLSPADSEVDETTSRKRTRRRKGRNRRREDDQSASVMALNIDQTNTISSPNISALHPRGTASGTNPDIQVEMNAHSFQQEHPIVVQKNIETSLTEFEANSSIEIETTSSTTAMGTTERSNRTDSRRRSKKSHTDKAQVSTEDTRTTGQESQPILEEMDSVTVSRPSRDSSRPRSRKRSTNGTLQEGITPGIPTEEINISSSPTTSDQTLSTPPDTSSELIPDEVPQTLSQPAASEKSMETKKNKTTRSTTRRKPRVKPTPNTADTVLTIPTDSTDITTDPIRQSESEQQ